MKIVSTLFLSVILLFSVYSIGAPQSQPSDLLTSFAFAAEFFCPEKAGGYIIDPDDEHRIATGYYSDTVYCDYGFMSTEWFGPYFNSVGGLAASYQFKGPYDALYHSPKCGEEIDRGYAIHIGSPKKSVSVNVDKEIETAGREILVLLEQSGLAIDCPDYIPPLDSDGDGVSDNVDVCPDGDDTIDTDGDGTPDACDTTPNGSSSSTDPDNDKVFGIEDLCPFEVGPIKNNGCPWKVLDAENYANSGDYTKVAEITDEILKTKPREMRAVWLGGIAHFNLEDYDTSVNRFRTYTEIAPQDYSGYVELGKSFIALENYNDAINILGEGISLTPPDKQPPINDLIHYAKIDYFYQQNGNNVCHPEKSNWSFTDTNKTTRTKNASDQIFSLTSQNHNFDREIKDVMFVKVINGNDLSDEFLVAWTETGVNTGKFLPDIDTYDKLFPITPDTIHFEFGNECTDVLKFTIFITAISTVDSDNDEIFDNRDSCINEKETNNNYQDRDGCPDTIPSDIDVIINYNSGIPGCEDNNSCYSTSTLNINIGDTVVWYNDDDSAHTVTSGIESSDGNFDSGLFMAGGTFSTTLDESGEYPYFCMVHPWMTGKIVVKYVPLDSDSDGILDENDLCRDDPENHNEFEDDDGCPDISPVDQCFIDNFENYTGDESSSEINDIVQKTISCVKDTQNNPKNPDVTIHLMGLYVFLAYNFEELGEKYFEQESDSWRQVISYATKVLNSDSNSDEAYFALAISYFELGDYQNALLAIENAIIIDSNDSDYSDFKNEIFQYQEDAKFSSYSITKNEGEVTIILDYKRNSNISGKETLFAGHSIETTTGKIDFSNEKAKFTLDENTSITITSSDNLKKIIDLKKGKLYTSFDKSLCEGVDCKIITPIYVQQITGTEFVIDYDERSKKTTVFLNEGAMDIFPNDGVSQSITGPKVVRVENTEIVQISNMSKNMWFGELGFTEFVQKQDESTKDFDQWMYFENLTSCENEEDCDASNASIRFFIPKGWTFDSIIDFDYSYSDFGDHGDYDDYDSGGYDYSIIPSSFDIQIPQMIFGNIFGDFLAYGDERNDVDHMNKYHSNCGQNCETHDDNGDDDSRNDDYDEDGCEEGCSGIIVDKYKKGHLSGEKFHEDTSMLWIGDWAFGEDEFILLLLEKIICLNHMMKVNILTI
jgi:plastocyanin/tetratricopeptide (TPR) repeat protein